MTAPADTPPLVYRAVVETRRKTRIDAIQELVATNVYGPYGTLLAAREKVRTVSTAIGNTAGYVGAGHVESSPVTWTTV